MSVLSDLLGGCSSHHFKETVDSGTYRVRKETNFMFNSTPSYYVEKEVHLDCVHEDCPVTRTEWKMVKTVDKETYRDLVEELTNWGNNA